MTHHDDLDQMLTAWLDDPFTPPAPAYLGLVLERTRRTRQRPAWANLERWLPMANEITGRAAAPPLRLAWLLLIGLLVVAIVAAVAVVGSRLLTSTPAIPQGGAAVLAFDTFNDEQPGSDIFLVRADGTDLRQLTTGPDTETFPKWSPDGARIAYRLSQGGVDLLALMDAGGGNRTTLDTIGPTGQDCVFTTTAYAGSAIWDAAWSPDGKAIVFPRSPGCDLFIVAADGSSRATRLIVPQLNSASPTWSPDGTRIAFVGKDTSGTGHTNIYVADVGSGGALTGGFQARRITDAGANLDWGPPRWSPDGTEVAAAAGTSANCIAYDSGTFDAFIVKADGSGQRVVAAETAKEYNPTWSPDGTRVAFQRIVDASEWVLGRPCTMATWVADADGTNPRRLDGLLSDDFQPPFWSPDGTRLVGSMVELIDGVEHFHLFVVSADGSSPTVSVDPAGFTTWQPVAAPLPPAPSFAASAAP